MPSRVCEGHQCASSRQVEKVRDDLHAFPNVRADIASDKISRDGLIHDGRPRATSAIARALPAASRQSSASTGPSACQPPSPRSCSHGRPASTVATSPGARAAADRATWQPVGLRLCAIAEEPPRPSTRGSSASPMRF